MNKLPIMFSLSLLGFSALNTAPGQTSSLDQWQTRSAPTSRDLLDVAYGDGTYVAVGGLPPFNPGDPIRASLISSVDGSVWTELALPTNVNFYGVSFVNNRFVAIGDSGVIITSTNGVNWTTQHSQAQNRTADIYPLGGVAFGNGRYVAMDRLLGNYCLASTNAIDWSAVQLQPATSFLEMNRVRFAQGRFVAGGVANNGLILTSTNGLDWVQHASPIPGTIINDVAFGAGRWVGVGDLAAIITSSDGTVWTKAEVPTSVSGSNVNLHGVGYADGVFIASGDSGTILTSTDGLNWVSRPSQTSRAMNAVCFGNGYFLSVGLSGAIIQSGPLMFVSVVWQANGAALTLSAPSNAVAKIQFSSDLVNWTDLGLLGTVNGNETLVDTNAVSSLNRSYRAVMP